MASSETLILPGAVDLHVHFRDPSSNPAETIASGSRAAMLGGYVMYVDMPNNPGNPTWSLEKAKEKADIIASDSWVYGAMWAGAQPEADNVGELEAMFELAMGAKFYATKTTGNDREYSADDFREAASEIHRVAPDKPIMLHPGEDNIEDFIGMIARDLQHPLHVAHVHSSAQVSAVYDAKARGLEVTCGVCPHHLFKTSHDVMTQGMFASMMPPLAHQDEAEKLFRYLVDGYIDVVETDHAPHVKDAKMKAEREEGECFGVPGIEFAVPLLLNQMRKGRITTKRLIEVTSTKPAEIIGVKLDPRTQVGWDLDEYRIESEDQHKSGSKWTPYLGMLAGGYVKHMTIGSNGIMQNWASQPAGMIKQLVAKRGTGI